MKIYQNGQWYDLPGRKVCKDGQWHTLKNTDKIYFDGQWRLIGEPDCAIYGYRRLSSSDPFSEFPLDSQAVLNFWPPNYYDLDGTLGKYVYSNSPFDFSFTPHDFFDNREFFPSFTAGYGTVSHLWAMRNGKLYKASIDSLGNLQGAPSQHGISNKWTSLNEIGYGVCDGQLYQVRYDGTTVLLDNGNSGWTKLFDEYFMVNNLTDNPDWTNLNTYVIYGIRNNQLYQIKEIDGPNGSVSIELINTMETFTHVSGYYHNGGNVYNDSYDHTYRRFGIADGRLYMLEPSGAVQIGTKSDWLKLTGFYRENGHPDYSDSITYPLAIDENTGLYAISPTGEILIDSGDYQDIDGTFKANSSYYGCAVKNGELYYFNHANGYYPTNPPVFIKISDYDKFTRALYRSSSLVIGLCKTN